MISRAKPKTAVYLALLFAATALLIGHPALAQKGKGVFAPVKDDPKLRVRVIYLSILGREPTRRDAKLALPLFKDEKTIARGNRALVWVLLNTPEFIFIQ